MKLIIDIPEEDWERYKKTKSEFGARESVAIQSIVNGTPLDDVKAEIESGSFTDIKGDAYIYVPYAFEILDNIGKAESEDK